jgi:hypothetical protein
MYNFSDVAVHFKRRYCSLSAAKGVQLERYIHRGEFGGTLITPKSQMIRGNFFKLFELNGKVYAIDTLNHMAVSHTKIYEFNSNSEYKILYETNSDDNGCISPMHCQHESPTGECDG